LGRGDLENVLVGNAGLMEGHARAVGDILRGGDSFGDGDLINVLVGDAMTLADQARGGNDVLVGGQAYGRHSSVENFFWGDAIERSSTATIGNDIFIFGANSGHDNFIMDYNVGDRIEFDFNGGHHGRGVDIDHVGSSTRISSGGVDVFLVGYHGAIDFYW